MKKLILKGYALDEQRIRLMINTAIDEMIARGKFTEDTVRRFLLNQTDEETSGGLTLTYGTALHYYKEITK